MAPVSIVTGAGSGIGAAIARGLAAEGHRVALVGRREAPLRETAAGMPDERALVIAEDVSDPEAPARIVEAVVERWGRVDALVNNAGAALVVPIAETDEPLLRRTFDVNTFAPALLLAACWPHFAGGGGGRVVNVSSMATVDPFPGFLVYAASKAAVESFVRSAHNEGAQLGIRAFAVAPGAVETSMLRGIVDREQLPEALTLDPRQVAEVVIACVLGRRDAEAGGTILVPSPSWAVR